MLRQIWKLASQGDLKVACDNKSRNMVLSSSPELLRLFNLDGDEQRLTSATYQLNFGKEIGQARFT